MSQTKKSKDKNHKKRQRVERDDEDRQEQEFITKKKIIKQIDSEEEKQQHIKKKKKKVKKNKSKKVNQKEKQQIRNSSNSKQKDANEKDKLTENQQEHISDSHMKSNSKILDTQNKNKSQKIKSKEEKSETKGSKKKKKKQQSEPQKLNNKSDSVQQKTKTKAKKSKKKKKKQTPESSINKSQSQSQQTEIKISGANSNEVQSSKSLNKKRQKKKKQDIKQSQVKKEQLEKQPEQQAANITNDTNKNKGKSISKSKKQKVQSINVLNRQLARQCVTKKSNFYLQKMEAMKRGQPVGRGSKKAKQRMDKQKKQETNERIKKKKSDRKKSQLQSNSYNDNESQASGVSKESSNRPRRQEVTREDSQRIIEKFMIDGGDYRQLTRLLPDIPKDKIRGHLRNQFQRCIEIITKQVQKSGRNIKDWQLAQKRQIIRQLHRIRCTNRLLSQANNQFRDKFHKLMMSSNDQTLVLESADFAYLYRKIEAFVRGFCTTNYSKRKTAAEKLEQVEGQDFNRQHLLEGGNIFNPNRVKRQYVKIEETKLQEPPEPSAFDPQKIIYQWSPEEEMHLCLLYVQGNSNEFILDNLRGKFGDKNRWKDFQILGRKLDHLIKSGLYKLQELTSKLYVREQRIEQDERKKLLAPATKCLDANQNKVQLSSFELMTKYVYNNKKILKIEQNHEHGYFKNIPLLQRQIFGHVESYKVKQALIKLLTQKWPPAEYIDEAIQVTKQFIIHAQQYELRKNFSKKRYKVTVEQSKGDKMDLEQQFDALAAQFDAEKDLNCEEDNILTEGDLQNIDEGPNQMQSNKIDIGGVETLYSKQNDQMQCPNK